MAAALNLGLVILLTGLLSLASLLLSRHHRRKKPMAAGLLLLAISGSGICGATALTAIGIVDYIPLNAHPETSVEIDIRQNNREMFHIRLKRPGKNDWQLDLRGTHLCLVTHEIDWDFLGQDIGLKPMYRLSAIYSNTGIVAHPPSRERLPIWHIAQHHNWLFWIHADAPNYKWLPIATGARYRLLIGHGYIVIHPLNPEAENATQDHKHPSNPTGSAYDT